MKLPGHSLAALAKRALPRSLLGRSLLIILIPLVLLQAVALQIFYGTHVDVVSRRLTDAIAGELALTVDILEHVRNPAIRARILANAHEKLNLDLHQDPGSLPPAPKFRDALGPVDNDLRAALTQQLRRPYTLDWTQDPSPVIVRIAIEDGVLTAGIPRKRLYTAAVYLFVLWVVGTSLLLFAIAAVFMRNQVRAIRRLALAAENFGMGRDQGPIRPEGAAEVRRAATAFNRMQERIRRFLQQRTEMLAGVSHDLRTPLTRLRLAIAMLPDDSAPEIAEMTADIDEMDRMIGGYLAFARGEGTEQAEPVDLTGVLTEIANGARRAGARITLAAPSPLTVLMRADAVRRAITNLVDNARRHARRIELSAEHAGTRNVQITVDDDGPGIPEDKRESVFRAFESGAVDGTGLGLTIARDIVRAHGGDISLEASPLGGLRARIRLPV